MKCKKKLDLYDRDITKSFPNQKCKKIWGFTHNVIVDFSIHRKRCVPVDVCDWLENDGEKYRQICLDIKVNYNGKKIGGQSLIWSQQKLSPELQREVHWWQVSHGRGSSFGNRWFRSSRGLGGGEASRGWRRRKRSWERWIAAQMDKISQWLISGSCHSWGSVFISSLSCIC